MALKFNLFQFLNDYKLDHLTLQELSLRQNTSFLLYQHSLTYLGFAPEQSITANVFLQALIVSDPEKNGI